MTRPCWIVATRDLNFHYRSTDKVVGGPGDLFRITDGDRFRSEFDPGHPTASRTNADPGFLILDDETAAELIAERDALAEQYRRQAERDASKRLEAEKAEADRVARREALSALVREAVPKPPADPLPPNPPKES